MQFGLFFRSEATTFDQQLGGGDFRTLKGGRGDSRYPSIVVMALPLLNFSHSIFA